MATTRKLTKIIKNGQVYELPNSSDFVDKTSNQTVAWVKTFSSEIVLPAKETTAWSSKTSPAVEFQVKEVADSVSTLDWQVVKKSWNQTIDWTKTFSTSPVVPSKTTDATNSWTAIATEAQVKKVADAIPNPWTLTENEINTWTDTAWKYISAKVVHDYVASVVSSWVNYRWQVASYDLLPNDPQTWDMYNVVAAHTTAPKFDAWTNVIWNGTAWDPMSESVDLSWLVDKASAQTISWVKTFTAEPKLPSKTSDATNDWTKPATEAQVYKKANTSDIWNGTVSFTQWWTSKSSITMNQSSAWTVALEWTVPCTQAEYDALPSSKATDWNDYFIYE